VTVGVLNALYTYQNNPQSLETLARQSCHIEIDILRKPIGKQDQYIAAYGGLKLIRFFSDERVEVEKVYLPETTWHRLNQELLLFDTHLPRQPEMVLVEQKANMKQRQDALRELRLMAYYGSELLKRGALEDFGRLLHESWQVKKSLARQISTPEIDTLYEKARLAGAIGGKITGAGGGGFLLLYCPREHQDRLRVAMGELRELPFHLEPDSSKVIFNYRRQGG
jgi:D-glycero-alpha-D-manno-heptose-7-phosphate kinase